MAVIVRVAPPWNRDQQSENEKKTDQAPHFDLSPGALPPLKPVGYFPVPGANEMTLARNRWTDLIDSIYYIIKMPKRTCFLILLGAALASAGGMAPARADDAHADDLLKKAVDRAKKRNPQQAPPTPGVSQNAASTPVSAPAAPRKAVLQEEVRNPFPHFVFTIGSLGVYHTASASPVPSTVTSLSGGFGFGAGLSFAYFPFRFLGIEAGTEYVIDPFFQNVTVSSSSGNTILLASGSVKMTVNALRFPVLLRFPASKSVAIGAGMYYTTFLGDIGCDASGSVTCVAASQSYSKSGLRSSDEGWVGSVEFRMPIGEEDSQRTFVVDARYYKTIQNAVLDAQAAGTSDFRTADIQVLTSLQFGF